jgi:alpha-galactosidase
MKRPIVPLLIVCSAGLAIPAALRAGILPGPDGTPAEMARADGWAQRFVRSATATAPDGAKTPAAEARAPFSFVLGSQPSSAFLPAWTAIPGAEGNAVKDFSSGEIGANGRSRSRETSGDRAKDPNSHEFGYRNGSRRWAEGAAPGIMRRSLSWRDPQTGLEVVAEVVRFHTSPAVEWVVRFKNHGTADTSILEQVLPLDLRIPASGSGESTPVLHSAKGALCCLDDFAPVTTPLVPGTKLHLQPGGGRSSSEVLPFFNLDQGNQGLVLGIGWTGQWAVTVRADDRGELTVQAGMAHTHLKLHPGEEIRTPRILVLCWEGERMRGNNLLRRFLLTHHRPQPHGRPLVLPVLIGSWGGSPATDHLRTIDRITRRNWPINLYWIDAEWFGGAPWYRYPGNWEVRKDLYPQGFRPISEALHQSGRKLLLWFEPQRVCRGTPWAQFRDRPGWLLELKGGKPEYQQRNMNWGVPHEDPRWIERESHRSQICEGDMLWNMGHPDARRFLTDWLSERIKEFGLDWYREDFNIAPLEYWQAADAPERQGMTEIRYVEGLYAMWDELLRRHPHLAIDNCASGGRRIDLESMGRATALWRTDWPVDAIHRQCHTFGLLPWVPLHMSDGAVLSSGNEYEMRSAMTAGLNVKLPPQDDEASARQAQAMIEQYLSIQRHFYDSDFYPLTPYSQAADAWLAYQLHLPGTDEGIVVVLKRLASSSTRATFRLRGLGREAAYEVTNLDTGTSDKRLGSQLTDAGLEIELPRQPDSAIMRYRRLVVP